MGVRVLGGLLLLLLILVSTADAKWRPFKRSSQNNSYNYSNISFSGNPQEIATAKANYSAKHGHYGHIGGGYGGANAEGVGYSSYSAKSALNNCCFTGQRQVAGQAVIRGTNGWFAVKLFW